MKTEFASLRTAMGSPVVLQAVNARGRVVGMLFTMCLQQIFRNDEDENVEVVYTFPLPWGAVLTDLRVTLGSTTLTGHVIGRDAARAAYESAIESGDAPVLLERTQAGLFTASLGSLKPGETAIIELIYAQLLDFEQGRVRLSVPTTLTPRFGSPVDQGGLQPHDVPEANFLAEYPFQIHIDVTGALVDSLVSCPTHDVKLDRRDDGFSVSSQGRAWLDRDFVLLMEGLSGESIAVTGPDPASGQGHHAMVVSYCVPMSSSAPAPLLIKFLVDCSGSMAGQGIALARTAINAVSQRMHGEDAFSFSRFGSTVQRDLSATHCSDEARRQLRHSVDQLQADLGGTEMRAALENTFAIPVTTQCSHHAGVVLLLTDGAVWDVERIIEASRRSGHRVFALGVGSAPAESLLREMAEATGGGCEFLTPNEDVAAAAQRLLNRMRSAVAVDVKLLGEVSPLWCSEFPKRLVPDETVHVYLRFGDDQVNAPVLVIDDQPCQASQLSRTADDLLARIVAARQIAEMSDDDVRAEIAMRYQLVTERTDLFLVFERSELEKTDGMPVLRKVRPMVNPSSVLSAGAARSKLFELSKRFAISSTVGAAANLTCEPSFIIRSINKAESLRRNISDRFMKRTSSDVQETEREDSASKLLELFSRAVAARLSFDRAKQVVADRCANSELKSMLDSIALEVGGLSTAWSCYLLWLHETRAGLPGLSEPALALLEADVQKVPPERWLAVKEMFAQTIGNRP